MITYIPKNKKGTTPKKKNWVDNAFFVLELLLNIIVAMF